MPYFFPRAINDGIGSWIKQEKAIVMAIYRTSALNMGLMLGYLWMYSMQESYQW